MPRTDTPPTLRHHRPSGRAVVTLNGKDIYCGNWGSQAAQKRYDAVISEWLASGRRLPGTTDLTIAELVKLYWQHCKSYYRHADGTPTGEADTVRYALRPLLALYGRELAIDFGPLKLKAVRQRMVGMKWARGYVNNQVARVKQVFRWAVENEHVPGTVYHALQAVAGLKVGRSEARETGPVTPVPEGIVDATRPYLSRQVEAMVDLQLLTGMRPGEVCAMRAMDIDMSGKLWVYRPPQHKTVHHGHRREIFIGPKAQAIIQTFLTTETATFMFSPAAAERERLEQLHKARTSPLTPSQIERAQRAATRRHRRKRPAGDRYDVHSYRRAIARACEQAFAMPDDLKDPHPDSKAAKSDTPEARKARQTKRREWRREYIWSPNQLRHTAGTTLRREFGLEAAQVILGHRRVEVTQLYAEKNVAAAAAIMSRVG